MEKALKLLKILRDDYIHGELDKDINEAINELEEAMKPKTCDGCKFKNTVKFVQVEDETFECCSVCVRQYYDYFEPKEQ